MPGSWRNLASRRHLLEVPVHAQVDYSQGDPLPLGSCSVHACRYVEISRN